MKLMFTMANSGEKFEIKGGVGFPNPLDPFEKKKQLDWGLGVARAIQSEWFHSYFGDTCKFFTQRDEFLKRRIYAKGLQSMTKYFDKLGTNGDTSLLNLAKKPITIIPKLVNITTNGMSNRGYVVKATAIDQVSRESKENYRKQIEDDQLGKDIAIQAKEQLGVEVSNMPIDQIPETKEEMQLHLQLEYKPSYEMSQELAIETVMKDSDYDNIINPQVIRDLIELGVGCVKHRLVPERGIRIERVNPENKMQSYTEDPYFRDCFWHAEYKRVLVSDVLIENDWLNDPENEWYKEQLIHSGKAWDFHFNTPTNERLQGTTNILYFTYRTTRERFKKIKEKATGEKIVSDASAFFDATKVKKEDYKRVSKVDEIIFEGAYVLGTDIMLKWEVMENMTRPKSNTQKVIDQYIMIAPDKEKSYINSLVARMMNIDDLIQICELKAQQMIQRMMPDGYFIDEDAIAEVDLGDGNVLKPQGLLDMFFQTGSIVGRTMGADGTYNYSKLPITELKTAGNLTKLQALRIERDSYRNDQREVIGLNKASDASNPDKESLVGLQKIAALNSNTATRHILDASKEITRRVAECTTYSISDVLKYFPKLKEDLIRKIGATSVEDLESMKDLHLRDFAIYLDMDLDDEERAKLEADMSVAIEKGYLSVADKYKVLNIKNFKQAVGYMSILMDKHAKKQQEAKAQEYKIQADENIRASQTSEQFKQQTVQMETEANTKIQKMISEGEIAKERTRGDENRKTAEVKGQFDIQVAELNANVAMNKFNELEDRKDSRSVKEATMNSKMIKQRKEDGAEPIDFENENVGMEEFELEED